MLHLTHKTEIPYRDRVRKLPVFITFPKSYGDLLSSRAICISSAISFAYVVKRLRFAPLRLFGSRCTSSLANAMREKKSDAIKFYKIQLN